MFWRKCRIKSRVSVPFSNCIDASTRYCAVFGHPVRHSASPVMQNAGIAVLGLNWRYLAFDVAPGDLRQAILGAGRMGFIGLNLTVPHKVAALECVDVVDDAAQLWGAINTIRFEGRNGGGEWQPAHFFDSPSQEVRACGYNTDADAIVRAIRESLALELKGTRVLVLGAGGAGRVAALRLAAEGPSELFLVNRTVSKAETVAAEIRERFPGVKTGTAYPEGKVDLVINGTSLGLKTGDPLPFEEVKFSFGQATSAFDMVYGTKMTPFLEKGGAARCKVADGSGMLLHQGAAALKLWSGKTPPLEVMRKALLGKIGGKGHA